jgi:Double zinc ribbon/Sel1 repeat
MLCTFCGTENRPENKFCGMCGVRMDRRQGERRGLQNSAALRCPSCGHINEAGHKFCGMCGARTDRRTLTDRRPMPPDASRATAIANAQLPTPETAVGRVAAPPPRVEPAAVAAAAPAAEAEPPADARTNGTIFRNESPAPAPVPRVSGPSFLGLGDEPANDAGYLLDDEGSSGGILKKLVLIAILAAIAGLVFVGWRSGTFRADPKPQKSPETEPAALPSPRSANQTSAPEASPSPSDKSASVDTTPSDSPSSSAATGRSDAKDLQPVAAKSPSPEPEERALSAADEDKSKPPATKVRAADPPVAAKKPSAALLRAQQYLQGRGGVRQNCEQGLVYLRAATQQNDPAAAVQMGALYASGHCVPQDRVMAYRWFNSAHELDPGNQWIQTDLQQLWARMTPQERQKAGP